MRVFAVEKNPNAIVTLRNMHIDQHWGDKVGCPGGGTAWESRRWWSRRRNFGTLSTDGSGISSGSYLLTDKMLWLLGCLRRDCKRLQDLCFASAAEKYYIVENQEGLDKRDEVK